MTGNSEAGFRVISRVATADFHGNLTVTQSDFEIRTEEVINEVASVTLEADAEAGADTGVSTDVGKDAA